VRDGLRWHLEEGVEEGAKEGVEEGAEQAVLRLTGRTLRFPAYCASAVRTALNGAAHRVGDLPNLDDDADRLVLARRLLREALIVPAVPN
jgi:hypothetical protein